MIVQVSSIIIAMVLWGLVHSFLASFLVKNRIEPFLGRSYRLVYNTVALISFLPILGLTVLLPDERLYVVPTPWRWGLVLIQISAVLAAGWTLWQTDIWHFLGLRQLVGESRPFTRLIIGGAYHWVRHPLYFFSLTVVWLSPIMTVNSLTLVSGITLYFYIGAIFEERKLVAVFGDRYRQYQETVPMLIPLKLGRTPSNLAN